MPDPKAFAESFGIRNGIQVGSFRLKEYSIGHEEIKRYRIYNFPLTFVFVRIGNDSGLSLAQLIAQVGSQRRIVNSHYGNPYECYIENVQIMSDTGQEVVISATGVGNRVFK